MATGGSPTQQEEDFRHTCSLCMEPYRGRSPKILPCFHTFCLPCLTALQESVTTATTERPLEEKTEPEENQPDSKTDGAVVEKEQRRSKTGHVELVTSLVQMVTSLMMAPTSLAVMMTQERACFCALPVELLSEYLKGEWLIYR